MTDVEIIAAQQLVIDQLQKRVKKLTRRLKEKKKYELQFLINAGCTPAYIEAIDEKDRKVMEEDCSKTSTFNNDKG